MKKILSAFLLSFATSFAFAASPQEEAVVDRCPSVYDLIKGGLSDTIKFKYANVPLYVSLKYGNYNTPWDWAFIVAIPQYEVTTKQEALETARSALALVRGNPSPVKNDEYNFRKYICMYDHEDYFVLALTPTVIPGIDTGLLMASKFKQMKHVH